ncbi:glutamine-hydrolyzing carbamoyl-phosphate synthase small subunit [Novosphingopyxis sp. YJ-S2-01]|uniref:glutamine-hydrolyzing carbamoyl-phosphate synthase small subunit n=1 Tax=Novosphingopyxis sp. YJ-S2-01 TaxID=2794021 RepID=UPI0018DBFD40|nr:glutamine-hydrolyzing carbamoyl-phosphate synthase small subunit [Novosphingopyxis sp. YJ-S2-01]MBH9537945.1 glutamine-hydrolyzing carbamoyl-phosphate synthase small subunit [Novosphingopyxis sp. YJ-S2-01]
MSDTGIPDAPPGATGLLLLPSGRAVWGKGFGAEGMRVGELCFNTAMTGYQEVMTDPSYAGQIITFTFPHIGNVGANDEDVEADHAHALGCLVREDVTAPSNFRHAQRFDDWMAGEGLIGLSGVDTRALTRLVRREGAPGAVIAYSKEGLFDRDLLMKALNDWTGLEGQDLAGEVTGEETHLWDKGGTWELGSGFADSPRDGAPHVVAIDYGAKRNIFRNLVRAGARVTVVSARASLDDIMALKPDGVFLSNGPGDPAATGEYAVPVIQGLLERDMPIFGICLGHQLLGLALGAKTAKMFQGHRGANHPVKRLEDGVVEITSMNHGFAVDGDTLPEGVSQTHVSLFDGTNCGLETRGGRVFGVQYHPEASPGPQDSFYLFEKFVGGLR